MNASRIFLGALVLTCVAATWFACIAVLSAGNALPPRPRLP